MSSISSAPVDFIQQDLVKIVTDLVDKSPSTKEEIVELMQKLQLQIAIRLTKELPVVDQKDILFGICAVSKVRSCWKF